MSRGNRRRLRNRCDPRRPLRRDRSISLCAVTYEAYAKRDVERQGRGIVAIILEIHQKIRRSRRRGEETARHDGGKGSFGHDCLP